MNIVATSIAEVVVLEPTVFEDDRGYFYESFNAKRFADTMRCEVAFVQDNHAYSTRNVLRGLHYQIEQPQGKLVRVIRGEVFDVAVDIRKSSPTFGQWIGATLSGENRQQLWVPVGFAHGYIVRSECAEVMYKTTEYYAPAHERCILWNDPTLAIDWHVAGEPILSSKDQQGCLLADADVFS